MECICMYMCVLVCLVVCWNVRCLSCVNNVIDLSCRVGIMNIFFGEGSFCFVTGIQAGESDEHE